MQVKTIPMLISISIGKGANQIGSIMARARFALADKRGESSIGTAVAILTAVVLGALVLAGLYALLGDVVMPTLAQKIKDMFSYAG